ncbi:MAG TPA: hypothetical protein VL944_02075 [Candidatus Acidoferrum sp.]|nr:hypothetical protein [Candidatus Acidoferrum sp.]
MADENVNDLLKGVKRPFDALKRRLVPEKKDEYSIAKKKIAVLEDEVHRLEEAKELQDEFKTLEQKKEKLEEEVETSLTNINHL